MSPVTPSTKPCILLVDDDPDIGRALTDLLEHEQYQVMAVGTGTEAIAQARVRRFSAVILDLGLPDLDGLAVLKVLRDLDPNLPILVLTALTSEGRKASSVAAGAYGFLSKPYDKAELKETLLRAVAGNPLATKVQQVEQALACSDHREQQALLDSISEMFWYKDGDNRIIRTNASAAWSIGRSPLEVEGQSTYDLYPEEAEKYHQDDLEVITSGRTKRGIVEWYQAGSGEKRWVQTDKVPYRDAQGNIIGVLVFARDITDRMKTEEQSDAVPHKQDRRRPLASPAPHCSAHPSCTTSTCLR